MAVRTIALPSFAITENSQGVCKLSSKKTNAPSTIQISDVQDATYSRRAMFFRDPDGKGGPIGRQSGFISATDASHYTSLDYGSASYYNGVDTSVSLTGGLFRVIELKDNNEAIIMIDNADGYNVNTTYTEMLQADPRNAIVISADGYGAHVELEGQRLRLQFSRMKVFKSDGTVEYVKGPMFFLDISDDILYNTLFKPFMG